MFVTKIKKGFTLLEVLLVIAIIGILAAIVIVALNPNKQLGDARNAQRKSDVNTILNAVYQYDIDNSAMPATISSSTPLGVCKYGAGPCGVLVDLSVLVPKYVVGIPFDPTGANASSTGYLISLGADNRITVSAPSAENGMVITASK